MNSLLESLQFSSTGLVDGLVAVKGSATPGRIEEQFAIRQAADIGGIDYIFFRRFSDGRSSQAAACVIDNVADRITEETVAAIHQRLWLNGLSPLLYVGWETRVDVLSCARGPDFWTDSAVEYKPAESIHLTKQITLSLEKQVTRFSAYRLSDGTFWDDPANADLAQAEKAAHQQLIRAVVEADVELQGREHPVLRRLLLLTLLIKYLEDRGVFPDAWFTQFQPGASTFLDLLRGGSPEVIRALLTKLEKKFNGDVFELPDEVHRLGSAELSRFAELVEARTLGAQRYLWEQYSFRYIPVEVLSHLYQHFAQVGQGAVFTPPMVANLMLDYVLPYERMTGSEKVLDPTCGSGIFLVGAFRRLVHWWQSKHGWAQPDVATLKKILRQSIFGVELQAEALHLAAFSLALATCDALQPNVIWRELRFDKLVGSNLHIGDFSSWMRAHVLDPGGLEFDVVIGNPPFMSKLNAEARMFRKEREHAVQIPDNQMAYYILEQVMALLSEDGYACLIQPAGFLYNGKGRPFQRQFLSSNSVESVLDFTSIRNMYDGADPKTVAVLCSNRPPGQSHLIHHLTFRRTFSVKERIAFELDHYDRHVVTQSVAESSPWTWRVNLLGGGRLHALASRVAAFPKLRDFWNERGWEHGEGFLIAETGDPKPTPWLAGKPYLPASALREDGLDRRKIVPLQATSFHRPRTPTRYAAPLVLIKETETLPCAFWDDGFLAYGGQIVGVHAPKEQVAELKDFYEQFANNRALLQAFCAVFGTRAITSKATSILKHDVEVLPWPRNSREWAFSWWEKLLCDDVVQYAGDFIRLGQNSRLLQEQVSETSLKTYSDVFVRLLGSVYENLRPSQHGLIDGLAYQAFCFGEASTLEWPNDWSEPLHSVVYQANGAALRTVRVIRYYGQNTIILVKPDRLRYWISTTAIRDADETLKDLQRQGY